MAYYYGHNYPKYRLYPEYERWIGSIGADAYSACCQDNLDALKECIRLGFDVNWGYFLDTEAEDGYLIYMRTPLGVACKRNHFEMVKYLVGIGATINVDSPDINPPLLDACLNGNIELIEYLIHQGAELNTTIRPQIGPLGFILDYPNAFEIVKCLIRHGANVNAKNCYGQTILHCVPKYAKMDAVQLLIDNGADVNATDNRSLPPVFAATEVEDFPLVRLLVENGAELTKFRRVLDEACSCMCRTYDIARYLISQGAMAGDGIEAKTLVRHAQTYAMLCSVVHTTDVVRYIRGFSNFTHKM